MIDTILLYTLAGVASMCIVFPTTVLLSGKVNEESEMYVMLMLTFGFSCWIAFLDNGVFF